MKHTGPAEIVEESIVRHNLVEQDWWPAIVFRFSTGSNLFEFVLAAQGAER